MSKPANEVYHFALRAGLISRNTEHKNDNIMKKLLYTFVCCALITSMISCNEKKQDADTNSSDSIATEIPDSAIYGIVNESTTMSNLVITTDEGKTIEMEVNTDSLSDIQGGIFAGDRMAIITTKTENGMIVKKAINLTSLLGKWISLDRNFEINEDGVVKSNISAETKPYTAWSTINGNLVLNTDTFQVLLLGPDSLSLENNDGIFVYKRIKNTSK